eukprot:15087393-Alexandrium_andersonii.AAC.1
MQVPTQSNTPATQRRPARTPLPCEVARRAGGRTDPQRRACSTRLHVKANGGPRVAKPECHFGMHATGNSQGWR